MVFGNAGGTSGAGVGFTRDPATGARALYFDFCFNGQGEDVVAGRRTLADSDRLRALLPDACQRAGSGRRPSGGAVPRRPGLRVHRAGRQTVPAANPPRPAHAVGSAAHGGGHGGRGADHARAGAARLDGVDSGVARQHALRAAAAGTAGARGGGRHRRGERADGAGRGRRGAIRRRAARRPSWCARRR